MKRVNLKKKMYKWHCIYRETPPNSRFIFFFDFLKGAQHPLNLDLLGFLRDESPLMGHPLTPVPVKFYFFIIKKN